MSTSTSTHTGNQRLSTAPRDETCANQKLGWTLVCGLILILIFGFSVWSLSLTCNDPRFKLEPLSVFVGSNNTRAAKWDLAFSITDDPKTRLPLVCRYLGNGNFYKFQVSVAYWPLVLSSSSSSSVSSHERFEKTVVPFKPPRNGEVVSINATLDTLLPTTVDGGLALEFEVGLIARRYGWPSKRELHCENMTVWFSPNDTKGNIIHNGGDCFVDRVLE